MSAVTSSWLAADDTLPHSPAPGSPPRRAALPPNVQIARPMGVDGPEPPPIVTAPQVEVPTVEQRRERIAAAREALAVADAASDAAQAALHKAQQHGAACVEELAQFDDVDEQLKQLHVEALRSTEYRPRVDVPDTMRARITNRDAARVALDAASAAVPVFSREAEIARGVASDARIKLSNAIDNVVAVHAVARLRQRQELACELELLDASILAFEQYASGRVPRAIADFALELYASGNRRVALLDTGQWRALHQRLSENADATLTLTPMHEEAK